MNFIRNVLGLSGAIVLGLAAVLFLCGFGASMTWVLEMFTHERLIYIGLFAIAFLLLALANYRKLAILAVLLMLVASVDVVKYWFHPPSTQVAGDTVKVLQMNLWGGKNRKYEEALAAARTGNPDVIALSEVTMPWWLRFVQECPDYPYQIVEPRYGGVGILSKLPMKLAEVRYYGRKKRPRIYAQVTTRQGTPLDLIFVHTVTPFYLPPMRDGELEVVAQEARSSKNPVILFGDMNCSPWSPVFSRLLSQSGLSDSQQGFGIQPSWAPHVSPCPLIPIDHVLQSKNVKIVSREIGREFGSDHRPVSVQLSLRQ